MRAWRLAAGVAAAALAAAAVAGYAAWRSLDAPLAVPAAGHVVEIPRGTPFAAVADRLHAAGVLARPRVLSWYARLTGHAARVRAGEYRLEPGLTPRGLLDRLVAGRVLLHAITLVEGWTFAQVRAALAANDALTQTLAEATPEEIMAALGAPGTHPEGQFFPDTYRFPRGTTDLALLAQAHAAMRERLAEAWEARAPGLPYDDPYAALTLASIVEKETSVDAERARVAGVFVRRLRLGMRLQSDPTVIYGLSATFDGDLRTRDLKADAPYNTYTRAGLPPTPIAMPGAASLRAAVAPEEGDALYFVATGEGGAHHFSATLAEHERAVERYLARLRETRDRP
jgi:UPF0755 protein